MRGEPARAIMGLDALSWVGSRSMPAGTLYGELRRVRDSDASRYLLRTECSMGDTIVADNPDNGMMRICGLRCPHMNRITLDARGAGDAFGAIGGPGNP